MGMATAKLGASPQRRPQLLVVYTLIVHFETRLEYIFFIAHDMFIIVNGLTFQEARIIGVILFFLYVLSSYMLKYNHT